MTRRQIFVIGLARSGTNLLARMLARHPAVAVALDPLMPLFRSLRNALVQASAPCGARSRFRPESPFQDFYFDPEGPALLDTILNGDAGLALAPEELARLQRSIPERAALESPQLAARLAAAAGETYAALIRSSLDMVAALKPGAPWVGCKEVWIYDFVPLLSRAFPEARFYAIERDPRAIVASLVTMAARDATQAAHPPSYMRHWRKSVALSRRFAADPVLGKRFRIVTYEAMVADPGREARRICAELGLPYVDTMLDLSEDGWVGNSSYAHADRNVYASSSERWRSGLAPDAVRACDFLCGLEMSLTHYAPQSPVLLDDQVFDYLGRAGSEPGSWRSDSGDAVLDWGGELLRYALISSQGQSGSAVIRRCFLFDETFAAIRSTRRQGAVGIQGTRGL